MLRPRALLRAPAKLTLSLRITGLLEGGLHALDAEMVTLDLQDDLVVSELADGPVDPDGRSGPGDGSPGASEVVFSGTDDVIDPVDNLVTKALILAGCRARVAVTKRIPAGAGLGGGSADAAAVLRWAGFHDQQKAARSLGADLAFCLVGGRAHVTGFGDLVEPLPFKPLVVTLLTPPLRLPTAEVFKSWDRLGGPQGPGVNDLELAALAVEPGLVRWRDELAQEAGQPANLAGSGSTWFVYGAHPGPGRVVARTVPPSV